MENEITDNELELILVKSLENIKEDFVNAEIGTKDSIHTKLHLLETGFYDKPDKIHNNNEFFCYGICEILGVNGDLRINYENCRVAKNLKLALKEMIKGYAEGLYSLKDIVVIGFSEKREENGILLNCSEYSNNFMRLSPLTKIDQNQVHDIYCLERNPRSLEDESLKSAENERVANANQSLNKNNYAENDCSDSDIFKLDVLITHKECTIIDFLDGVSYK
jgi:hypothetical protein